MTDTDSEWETESSDFTDYEGEIIRATFQTNKFRDQQEIELELATNDPKLPVWHERYSLGTTKGGGVWMVLDDGQTVEATDGATKFRSNSNYGKLVDKAVVLAGKDLTGAGSPREAAVWLGLKFRFGQDKGSFPGADGRVVNWTKNFPVEYLGKV